MKESIHPKFYADAIVTCACGNTWTTGSTRKELHTDVCFKCHPFYTGEQRIVDTEGQVDRFYKKLEARDKHTAEIVAREAAKTSPDQPISVLELGPRAEQALLAAGITTIAEAVEKLAGGDDALLAISGFGRKSLIDMKKRLRARGLAVADGAAEAAQD
jgi:large subunit ribosomal protein L31